MNYFSSFTRYNEAQMQLPRDGSADAEYRRNLELVRERVRAFLLSRKQAEADAEDVAQDCIVILVDRYPNVRGQIDLLKLATRIAGNRICQLYRERARMAPLVPGHVADRSLYPDPEESAGRREMVDRILFGMMELQARCRDLLRMLLIEQMEYADVRAILGLDPDYIYVLRQRCLQALRRNVGGTFYGT
jgi:RNA polymerase sigma factor (sigma-70 family)